MGISASAKRNRIANYMDLLPEEFEVIEDNLGTDNPSIKFQTKSRIISIGCDEKGKIIEEFTMRDGAGTKEEFLSKLEAYEAVKAYYNDYYTGAKITKNSFEEGIIKLEIEDKTVTLSYDNNTKSVEEKDRVHKVVKSKVKKDKKEEKLSASDNHGKDDQPYKQLTLFDVAETPIEGGYEKWTEGTKVKNTYNNKEYKVKHDDGNIIEVFDTDHGYLIMARADLKVVIDGDN